SVTGTSRTERTTSSSERKAANGSAAKRKRKTGKYGSVLKRTTARNSRAWTTDGDLRHPGRRHGGHGTGSAPVQGTGPRGAVARRYLPGARGDVRHAGSTLPGRHPGDRLQDRKSTRLNSSHVSISYAVFCLIKKK